MAYQGYAPTAYVTGIVSYFAFAYFSNQAFALGMAMFVAVFWQLMLNARGYRQQGHAIDSHADPEKKLINLTAPDFDDEIFAVYSYSERYGTTSFQTDDNVRMNQFYK